MTKPDFYEMSRKELRQYVLKNRGDEEAFQVLLETFDRSGPIYAFPDEDMRRAEALLKEKIGQEKENLSQ